MNSNIEKIIMLCGKLKIIDLTMNILEIVMTYY